MAVDMFLEIDGIKGESKDDKHKDTIQIESFSWGVSQSGSAAVGGGAGAGKATFQDFSFMKAMDKASPILMLKCATGEHIPKATLYVRKSGGEQLDYYTVKFAELIISAFQQSGSPDGGAHEGISFNYTKIELEYREQTAKGTLGAPVKAGYDVKANKKI